jgi:hypothetical protein
MRLISTRTHGILDYLMGTLLITAPVILDFATGGPGQWMPTIIGTAMIGMALMTDYESAVVRLIPMPAHLAHDFAAGALLAASPWVSGFADIVFWPHLILGVLGMGVSLTTETHAPVSDASSGAGDVG